MKANEKQAEQRSRILFCLIGVTLVFIWGNSLMPGSVSGAISDWAGNVLHAIFGGQAGTTTGNGVLRKVAHMTEFAILGAELSLLWRDQLRHRLSTIFLCGLGTAVLDETIQLFSSGRAGQLRDVWIDTAGFTIGVLLTAALIRHHLKKQHVSKPKP